MVNVAVYLLQRLARSRVRAPPRAPPVAGGVGARAPGPPVGARRGGAPDVVSLAARALILPALAWGLKEQPPFHQMSSGARVASCASVVRYPRGRRLEVAFLNGSPEISAPAR